MQGKRARGGDLAEPRSWIPPEDWYEPVEDNSGEYRVITQPAGPGYRHVLSVAEATERLDGLPKEMTRGLEVLQFSRMTRKKSTFPCYGMQWGRSIYLYPIEEELIEYYNRPPTPMQLMESKMHGGKWEQCSDQSWRLVWSEAAIKDYYLNNILIHELGHLLDDRNSNYLDRERYAEWFAIEYGYRASRAGKQAMSFEKPKRRHHKRRM